MRFARQLLAVEIAALASLLVISAGMAIYAAVIEGSSNSAQFAFALTLALGSGPALVLGAPIYLLLLRRRMAQWPYVFLIGILPGTFALFFEISIGLLSIICGIVVTALTHLLCHRL